MRSRKERREDGLTEPEDPEDADEAKFGGGERGECTFAEEFDNET